MSYGNEFNSIKNKIDWDLDALGEGLIGSEAKINVLLHYALHGSIKEAAEFAKVDHRTVTRWKQTSSWWDTEIAKVRKVKTDELEGKYSKIIEAANEQIMDRIEKGDYKLDKYGNQVRLPMGGRDLVMVSAILFDKQRLLKGEATHITGKTTTLEELMNQFEKMSNQNQGKSKNGKAQSSDAGYNGSNEAPEQTG